jgi:DNA-binding LacI/PurR family transcriptional regulator
VQRRNKKLSKRPTQRDIARLAGVSIAVVSAVLNDRKGTIRVSTDVARRVRGIIADIGYVPNPIARSLVNSERNIVGVFTFDTTFPYRRENFFYPFLQGIEEEIEGSGFDLLLFTAGKTLGNQRSIFPNGANRLALADGAIILGENYNRSELESLAKSGFPFVVIGRREVQGTSLNCVAAAYTETTELIVTHAFNRAHRSFLYVGQSGENERQLDRLAGFETGLSQHGIEIADCVYKIDHQGDWIDAVWERIEHLNATMIVAEDAEIAEVLDQHISAKGLKVPEHISLCTLADPVSERGRQRQFSRLVVPRLEMGAEAVRMLLQLLKDDADSQPIAKTLGCAFEVGTTIAAAS